MNKEEFIKQEKCKYRVLERIKKNGTSKFHPQYKWFGLFWVTTTHTVACWEPYTKKDVFDTLGEAEKRINEIVEYDWTYRQSKNEQQKIHEVCK